MFKSFESLGVKVVEGEDMPRQLLNAMLVDFSYRTVVKIVEHHSDEVLFKGTVSKYQKSELKNKPYLIEVAEVFDGEFVIKVIEKL